MPSWSRILQKPHNFRDGPIADAWFSRIAEFLLNGCRLVAGGKPHRLVEVELYYWGDGHRDPFAHRDPLQQVDGNWYFHRSRGAYRGGSYKGLDLVFSDGQSFGGALIRSIEAAAGELISGPSLCVDQLLRLTRKRTVLNLVDAIDGRFAWDDASPLFLRELRFPETSSIYRSARVGLSLKRAASLTDFEQFVVRPYRFLTEPRRIAKGKAHLVLALHQQGADPEQIRLLTGAPVSAIRRHLVEFGAGRKNGSYAEFLGQALSTRQLCRLHGTCFEQQQAKPLGQSPTIEEGGGSD